jgi:signal transduction histidine kinase
MTGLGDTEAMRKGMEMGADDYLPKPFTAPQLLGAIDARLRKRELFRQSAEKKLADLRANLTLALPHEMVTPLNGIFGLAQLLAAEAQTLSPQEVAEFGRDILLCAERLQRTVQNFLLYGQLEIQAADPGARAALRAQRTEQCGALIENRARRAATAAHRGADLQLEVAGGAVAMASDLFTRLVDELVGNAFKFSQSGHPVRVVTTSDNGFFKLAVEDRGVGMTPEQIASVSAYTQFDRRRHEQQGAGLGLAIVKRLAELHGGELKIQSEPGVGTTVHVSLPGE